MSLAKQMDDGTQKLPEMNAATAYKAAAATCLPEE